MSATNTLPVQIDTALADLYNERQGVRERFARFASSALSQAGADWYYRGRQRVTDLTLTEAEARLEAALRQSDPDDYGYGRLPAPCSGSSSTGNARRTIEGLAECRAELRRLDARMEELESRYTGWSRFFLVTSSPGHVHSSMHCSTCRPTTTYGWLPELSGQSEAEAVAQLGPNLCSVCFPSAPVEWVGGKLTKSQATKAAH